MTIYDENETPWFTKDRSETSLNRYPSKTIGNNILVENPALGINLQSEPYLMTKFHSDGKETLKNAFKSGQLEFKKIWELE